MDEDPSAKRSPWEDWGTLVAVTSVVLPAFGVAVRAAWLQPHPGVPFQAVVQVSIAQLAIDGLVALFGPAFLGLLFAYGLGRLRPFVGREAKATSAQEEVLRRYDKASASAERLQADLDKLERQLLTVPPAERDEPAPKRLVRRVEKLRAASSATKSEIDDARAALDAAKQALHDPWIRLRLAWGIHRRFRRIAGLAAFIVSLTVYVAVILGGSPETLAAIVAYGILTVWLWNRADSDRRVPLRIAAPAVLVVGFVASLWVGLTPTSGTPVWVTFDSSSPHPTGWYSQISDVQETVYLVTCDGSKTIVAPLSTIAALDYGRVGIPRVDNSILHLIQTQSLPTFGLTTLCPAGNVPPP